MKEKLNGESIIFLKIGPIYTRWLYAQNLKARDWKEKEGLNFFYKKVIGLEVGNEKLMKVKVDK